VTNEAVENKFIRAVKYWARFKKTGQEKLVRQCYE
jgi:hypothetical protein